jgi:hypothetical protein
MQCRSLPRNRITRASLDTFGTMAALATRIHQQDLLMEHACMLHPSRPMSLSTSLDTQTTIGWTAIDIAHKHFVAPPNPFLQYTS